MSSFNAPSDSADAEAYDRLQIIAHEKTHSRVLEILGRFPSRGPLLEIPAGEGALAWQLHKLGYEVTGGDIDPAFFKVRPLRCIYLDMDRPFPLPDGSFDFISCVEGIEHLQDQFQFVRECHRILRPNGHLVLSTPNILNLGSRLKFLFSGFYSLVPRPINEFSQVPVFDHIHPVTYYQLRYILHTQGFHITEIATDIFRRSAAGLYWLKPAIRLYSIRTMRKERDPRQRAANREIRRILASPRLLLGRSLILVARKKDRQAIPVVQASAVREP
jgi:SAM-dependent methyltransferase